MVHHAALALLCQPPMRRRSTIQVLLVGSLVALGLAVRWPNLHQVPQFPAGALVLQALDVAAGRTLPLADSSPYLGSLFILLLAAAFKLVGPSVETVVLLPWLLGGLAVVPTYLLGRELGGRTAGLVAGGLLATSPAHTVISSHVPWVHSLTPLFATITLWLLVRAARRLDGWSLALAGLASGLSLQTHPTVLPLLAGAVGAVLVSRPAWLRTRWFSLAVLLVLLGYSSLLAHHIQTSFAVVGDVQAKQASYVDADVDPGENVERGVYSNNLELLLVSLVQLTAGALDEWEPGDDLPDPVALVYALLAITGLVLAARQGEPWLLFALLPAILLPPLLNGKYKPILDGRYLMPLVPVLFVGIGLLVARLSQACCRGRSRRVSATVLPVLGTLLIAHPLLLLAEFYESSHDEGRDNSRYFRTLQQVQRVRGAGQPVLLDPRLRQVKSIGGNAGDALLWLLAVSDIPTEFLPRTVDHLPSGSLIIVHRDTAENLEHRADLVAIDRKQEQASRSESDDGPSFQAYHLIHPAAERVNGLSEASSG